MGTRGGILVLSVQAPLDRCMVWLLNSAAFHNNTYVSCQTVLFRSNSLDTFQIKESPHRHCKPSKHNISQHTSFMQENTFSLNNTCASLMPSLPPTTNCLMLDDCRCLLHRQVRLQRNQQPVREGGLYHRCC